MTMDEVERRGFCIAIGIIDGGVFNWLEKRWEKAVD